MPALRRPNPRLGILTLGQTPRTDVVPAMTASLGPSIDVTEHGLLDDAAPDEIRQLTPSAGESAYVTRLRNGQSVELSASRLEQLLPSAAEHLSHHVDAILLLCSGSYPGIDWPLPTILPDQVLSGVLAALSTGTSRTGVVCPHPSQTGSVAKKWSGVPGALIAETASPYDDDQDLEAATDRLIEKSADHILLDCMGFGPRHRAIVRERTAIPLLLPTTLIAHVIGEVLS